MNRFLPATRPVEGPERLQGQEVGAALLGAAHGGPLDVRDVDRADPELARRPPPRVRMDVVQVRERDPAETADAPNPGAGKSSVMHGLRQLESGDVWQFVVGAVRVRHAESLARVASKRATVFAGYAESRMSPFAASATFHVPGNKSVCGGCTGYFVIVPLV